MLDARLKTSFKKRGIVLKVETPHQKTNAHNVIETFIVAPSAAIKSGRVNHTKYNRIKEASSRQASKTLPLTHCSKYHMIHSPHPPQPPPPQPPPSHPPTLPHPWEESKSPAISRGSKNKPSCFQTHRFLESWCASSIPVITSCLRFSSVSSAGPIRPDPVWSSPLVAPMVGGKAVTTNQLV